ncbi:MAG: pyridoxamine 5'-phosphate oxidase family protein [Halapricum sp.]
MSDRTAVPMDTDGIDDFLGRRQTGVLSLASGDGGAYGFPISFVHEPIENRLYFRFAYGPESQKREFFETTGSATFVVHEETDEGWKSVVAAGELADFLEPEVPVGVVDDVNDIDIPFFQVFEHPESELEFRIVALDIREIHGRIEAA